MDREVRAGSEATAEAAEQIITSQLDQACWDKFSQWKEQLARGRAVDGLAGAMAAPADGRAAEVFIADEPGSTAQGAGPASSA